MKGTEDNNKNGDKITMPIAPIEPNLIEPEISSLECRQLSSKMEVICSKMESEFKDIKTLLGSGDSNDSTQHKTFANAVGDNKKAIIKMIQETRKIDQLEDIREKSIILHGVKVVENETKILLQDATRVILNATGNSLTPVDIFRIGKKNLLTGLQRWSLNQKAKESVFLKCRKI